MQHCGCRIKENDLRIKMKTNLTNKQSAKLLEIYHISEMQYNFIGSVDSQKSGKKKAGCSVSVWGVSFHWQISN